MTKDRDRELLEQCIDDSRSYIENYPRIVDT
jgi:hypothetical protein